MKIGDAIGIIDSVAGFTDTDTPAGEAWDIIRKHVEQQAAAIRERDLARAECRAWRTAWDGQRNSRVAKRFCDPDHHHLTQGKWDGGGDCEYCLRFFAARDARAANPLPNDDGVAPATQLKPAPEGTAP